MRKQNIYRDVQVSLLRFSKEFQALMASRGLVLGFVNLDAHADQTTWPKGDFLGMGELTVDIGSMDTVQVGFAIATEGDPNLLRMSKIVNELTNYLLPGCSVMVVDAETGAPRCNLRVADGVRVGAPLATKSQPMTPIMVNFLSDLGVY